ncbi:MAG: DUF2953 domain-containing protein [Sporolactobacillus sp.]
MFLLFLIIGLLLLGLFLGLLYLLKSTISFRMTLIADTEQLTLRLHLFFRRKELRVFTWDDAAISRFIESHEKTFLHLLERPDKEQLGFFDWIYSLKKVQRTLEICHVPERIQVTDFVWITSVGTGEADKTALLTGAIWSLKCLILPLITGWLDDPPPRIKVVPLFQEKRLATRFSCMISFKAGKAMLMMRQIRRQMKEGERDGRTSNTRVNEDSTG